MPEHNKVSIHEARIFHVFTSQSTRWLTNADVAAAADVAPRTARAHTLKLVGLGLLDQAELFPAHRYRLAEKAMERNLGYWKRLQQVSQIFGIGG